MVRGGMRHKAWGLLGGQTRAGSSNEPEKKTTNHAMKARNVSRTVSGSPREMEVIFCLLRNGIKMGSP